MLRYFEFIIQLHTEFIFKNIIKFRGEFALIKIHFEKFNNLFSQQFHTFLNDQNT